MAIDCMYIDVSLEKACSLWYVYRLYVYKCVSGEGI